MDASRPYRVLIRHSTGDNSMCDFSPFSLNCLLYPIKRGQIRCLHKSFLLWAFQNYPTGEDLHYKANEDLGPSLRRASHFWLLDAPRTVSQEFLLCSATH